MSKIKEKEKTKKGSIKKSKKEDVDNNQKAECLTVMTGNNYNVVDISLPNNFFEQIIENEIELSEGFKYEKLSSLVQLYLNGIQYYSSFEPEKVRAYQNRLEFLLTQKDTLKNLCNRKKNEEEIKSSKSSNQIRGRLKTKFKIETEAIKKDDITQKVKQIKNEHLNTKDDKKNVKVLINNEFESQSKKWKERLAEKRRVMNSTRSLLRTSGKKFFKTPGPVIRKTISVGTKRPEISKFEKSGKALFNYGGIDDDDSEDENKSENGESDFLKMFKEKHNDENKKDSDDEGSIIDDNYNDDDLNKIEEIEEENEDKKKLDNNVIKNTNEKDDNKEKKQEKKPLKGILKKKKHEKEENSKKIEEENNEKKQEEINNLIQNVKIIENNEKKEEENIEEKEENIEEKEENIEKKENTEKNKENIEKKEEEKKEEKKKEEGNAEKKEEGNIEKKDGDNTEKKEEEKKNEKKEENIEKKEEEKNNKDENNKDLKKEDKIKNENNNVFINKSFQRKKSIVDVNVIRRIEPDDEIKNTIEEKMKILDNLKDGHDSGEDSNDDSPKEVPIVTSKINMEEIPPIFQETLGEVEEKMKEFTKNLRNHFYKESFELFSIKLKDLYDSKYKKYIMVNNEYHSSITENEYLLENEENLSEEKKTEIKSIIDSLKEEQKDQIDKIVDEYNNNIILLINEFKQNSFKKNISVQLLEEQLKLDIYSLINESFY